MLPVQTLYGSFLHGLSLTGGITVTMNVALKTWDLPWSIHWSLMITIFSIRMPQECWYPTRWYFNFATSLLHNNCLQNVSQFTKDLQDKSVDSGNPNLFISSTVGYIYDAVWTIALALNSSISILEDRGLGRLEDFTYDSVEMANVFTEAVANVSFEGISVSYNNFFFACAVLLREGGGVT